jgi:hypothetical protein
MTPIAAFMLGACGTIGFYVIGSAAIDHKRAIQAGEPPTHIPDDYESSTAEDLVAFTISMVALGVVFDQTPAMITEVEAIFQ